MRWRPPRTEAGYCTVAAGLVAVAAAAYLVARAVRVPLTYDEATSVYRYFDTEFAAVVDFAAATNHLLNTVVTRIAHDLFGAATWALRLPNLLAGLAYLGVAVLFARRTASAAIGCAGAVLLATNPLLLDYFALARGYGLAIAWLVGSWLYWLRWWEQPPAAARKHLALALALSAAAVAANYAVLPAFVAIVVLTVARLGWHTGPEVDRGGPAPRWSWTSVVAWALLATVFTALVFARERVPSRQAYAPVTVRVAGVFPEEAAAVHVFRYDSTGRLREFARRPDGTWRSGPVDDAWRLRVTLPAAVDHNLAVLEVTAGSAVYTRSRQAPGPWLAHDVGDTRVLTSTDELRWRGDAAHRRFVATRTAATVAALATLFATLVLLARVATRWRPVLGADARILVWAIVAVASVAAAPLYLLRRDGQLFFGGTSGFVPNTVGSLVLGTAYGTPASLPTVLGVAWIVVAAVILLAVLVGVAFRSHREARWRVAAAFLGVLALCVVQIVVQHAVLKTPYPMGRTALFLLPLFLIVVVVAADALATLGAWWRRGATSVMALLAVASLWHGVRVANLSHAFDWPGDSAIPGMLREVAAQDAAARSTPGLARVGVHWTLYPTARYYADRLREGDVRVEPLVLPGDGLPLDFAYARPASPPLGGVVIVQHPVSGAELRRLRP